MLYSIISQLNIQKHTSKLNSWKNLDASSPLCFPPSFKSISLINNYISRAWSSILLFSSTKCIRNNLPISYQRRFMGISSKCSKSVYKAQRL